MVRSFLYLFKGCGKPNTLLLPKVEKHKSNSSAVQQIEHRVVLHGQPPAKKTRHSACATFMHLGTLKLCFLKNTSWDSRLLRTPCRWTTKLNENTSGLYACLVLLCCQITVARVNIFSKPIRCITSTTALWCLKYGITVPHWHGTQRTNTKQLKLVCLCHHEGDILCACTEHPS